MRKLCPWPQQISFRNWQIKARRRLSALNEPDALVVATPGSGKTIFSLGLAHDRLSDGLEERVVIVCPTDHLRFQWAEAAHRVGIEIDPRWSNADGVESPDYHGVAVTYQQVAFAPDLFRMNCGRPTLVILDEIHHAGDELSWGNAIRHAFEPTRFRLCLSGTPFRSDNNKIPFITYKNGRSKADFEYSYAHALADGVCRPVYFPTFEGQAEWLSRDGQIMACSLLDPISQAKAAERLRTILDPEGDWLRRIIAEANAELRRIRSGDHPEAGGLIIAIDQSHARRISQILKELTGLEPEVAISDMPDASDRIKQFACGNAPWIVAVKMISEGVDIPRLRVGVYATNVLSELFFRQAIGRLLRIILGIEEQSASLFIPAVEPLISFARAIKEERDHQLEEDIEETLHEKEREEGDSSSQESSFVPLSSSAEPHEIIFDGDSFEQPELAHAEKIGRRMGIKLPPAQLAALIRVGAAQSGAFIIHRHSTGSNQPSQTSAIATSTPKHDRKNQLRRNIQRLASRLAYAIGVDVREIHSQWIKDLGGMPQAVATEDDLERKQKWLILRIREVGHAKQFAA